MVCCTHPLCGYSQNLPTVTPSDPPNQQGSHSSLTFTEIHKQVTSFQKRFKLIFGNDFLLYHSFQLIIASAGLPSRESPTTGQHPQSFICAGSDASEAALLITYLWDSLPFLITWRPSVRFTFAFPETQEFSRYQSNYYIIILVRWLSLISSFFVETQAKAVGLLSLWCFETSRDSGITFTESSRATEDWTLPPHTPPVFPELLIYPQLLPVLDHF